MFDVGFFELIVIFVIGLLVLGPERLPRVASRIGGWIGQARRMTRNLKYQLEDELALQERQAKAKQFMADIEHEIKGDGPVSSPQAPEAKGATDPGSAETDKAQQ